MSYKVTSITSGKEERMSESKKTNVLRCKMNVLRCTTFVLQGIKYNILKDEDTERQ